MRRDCDVVLTAFGDGSEPHVASGLAGNLISELPSKRARSGPLTSRGSFKRE